MHLHQNVSKIIFLVTATGETGIFFYRIGHECHQGGVEVHMGTIRKNEQSKLKNVELELATWKVL